MVTIDYFLLCETVIRDEVGRVTLVNTFDTLNIPEFPAVVAKFALVSKLYPQVDDLRDGKLHFKIEITDPKGKIIRSVSAEGAVDAEILKKHQGIVTVADLAAQIPFNMAGTHIAALYVNDKHVQDRKFEVNHKPQGKETL